MPQVLTDKQIKEYKREGYVMVREVLSPEEIKYLLAVTDEFVERSRAIADHDNIFDLEDGHTAEEPRIRRLKYPHRHHKAYADLAHHPIVVKVLQDLWGPNIRFQ